MTPEAGKTYPTRTGAVHVVALNSLHVTFHEVGSNATMAVTPNVFAALVLPGTTHRWNVEKREDGVYICDGEHDKNEACKFVRYVPADGGTNA